MTAPSGFTFSDGSHLPFGTAILGIGLSEISRDPGLWDDPNTFDGLRFKKLREKDVNRYQLASTGSDGCYTFGVGKYACPGRWFAAAQLVHLFSEIIRRYDLDMGGRELGSVKTMFMNLWALDKNFEMRFRNREPLGSWGGCRDGISVERNQRMRGE